jgi:hypothetical protein
VLAEERDAELLETRHLGSCFYYGRELFFFAVGSVCLKGQQMSNLMYFFT